MLPLTLPPIFSMHALPPLLLRFRRHFLIAAFRAFFFFFFRHLADFQADAASFISLTMPPSALPPRHFSHTADFSRRRRASFSQPQITSQRCHATILCRLFCFSSLTPRCRHADASIRRRDFFSAAGAVAALPPRYASDASMPPMPPSPDFRHYFRRMPIFEQLFQI